ncbi:hypothetical protein BDK51DRAFT_47232 [Blyttiomyces helicus]|uniref:Uncharacterized protein n=1 Tax=Blyttiomyces helicus TaxID=388810 RepID=A0A4P9W1Y1_9FUNG|nr:hypothetical protein BDK51DRAFT_47232 [Blyttiomyces helicus]|eukprot:RKO86124.1 hypothetical protein BDK51DRAFT_47232 [Blyttiomyces helicus]
MTTDYPAMTTFLTERLPRVFRTAATFADIGLLRLARLIAGWTMVQASPFLSTRVPRAEIERFSVEGRTLRAIGAETAGIEASLRRVAEAARKGKAALRGDAAVVVTVKNVAKPVVDVGLTDEEWRDKWHAYQRAVAAAVNGSEKASGRGKAFVVDETADHGGLCASESVVEAIQAIAEAGGFKNVHILYKKERQHCNPVSRLIYPTS